MENLPAYISILFGLTATLTVGIFYKAAANSKLVLLIIMIWLAGQALISLSDFYIVTDTIPPKFLLLVFPPFLVITGLFVSSKAEDLLMV